MGHIREFIDEDCHIELDLRTQVLGLDILDNDRWEPSEPELHPTIPNHRYGEIVSAAALALKAKQFDDGLYAAVELAAQNGAGNYPGKVFLLKAMAQRLAEPSPADGQEALAVVFAACELGGLNPAVAHVAEPAVKKTLAAFLGAELRSKPIGFYTWNRELEAIFRQDRMLQSPLRDRVGINLLVQALSADEKLCRTYLSYLNLIAKLTNPFTKPDLRLHLAQAGKNGHEVPCDEVFFFPPSKAHETDLMAKLFGDRPIPAGFSLMDELIARIRSGALGLKPTEQSGWYDHQIWSIEPLAIPEKMPEAARLKMDKRYREHLLELFKGIYALTRETHVKQLDTPLLARSWGRQPRVKKVYIQPELSAEPLATFYLRRALSYQFVRGVLAETFGPDALHHLHRLTPTAQRDQNLAEELDQMESLFYGAFATVNRQLGLSAESSSVVGSGRRLKADAERFRNWARDCANDCDLSQDARMMVPVFYDLGRRKTKVWVLLGWTNKPLRVYFKTPPRIVKREGQNVPGPATGLIGKLMRMVNQPSVAFTDAYHSLWSPVVAELYVEKILNRDEFRRHCDKYKTQSAILKNLAAERA
jgi:hypothetical protein